MTFTIVRKLQQKIGDSPILTTLDYPKSFDNHQNSMRCAGWLYHEEIQNKFYDGFIYLKGKNNGVISALPLSIHRPDVNSHLSNLGKLASGIYGFESLVTIDDYLIYVGGDGGQIDLYEILISQKSTVTSRNKKNVIMGHSGVGKSTFLQHKGLDRWLHDMDVFLVTQKATISLDNFIAWACLRREVSVIVIANDINFLREIKSMKQTGVAQNYGLHFIFVRVSFERFCENITKINCDGLLHKIGSHSNLKEIYNLYLGLYESIADETIILSDAQSSGSQGSVADALDRFLSL